MLLAWLASFGIILLNKDHNEDYQKSIFFVKMTCNTARSMLISSQRRKFFGNFDMIVVSGDGRPIRDH